MRHHNITDLERSMRSNANGITGHGVIRPVGDIGDNATPHGCIEMAIAAGHLQLR